LQTGAGGKRVKDKVAKPVDGYVVRGVQMSEFSEARVRRRTGQRWKIQVSQQTAISKSLRAPSFIELRSVGRGDEDELTKIDLSGERLMLSQLIANCVAGTLGLP
jgi:hypothetical protein